MFRFGLIFVLCFFVTDAVKIPCNITHTQNEQHVWCSGSAVGDEFMKFKFPTLISSNVTKIRITNGNFSELPSNMIGNCSGNNSLVRHYLTQLDLSHNVITTIHGKTFHCMPNLKKLSLQNNIWKLPKNNTHTGIFNNLKNLIQLDLTNTFKDRDNGSIHVIHLGGIFANTKYTKLEVLRLGSNELRFVDRKFLHTLCDQMPNLRRLTLDNNLIIKVEVPPCFKKLELLDLSSNSFDYLDSEILNAFDSIQKASPTFAVKLMHQEWDCGCNIIPFHNWLKTTQVQVYNKIHLRCYDGKNFNKTIMHLQTGEMKCYSAPQDSSVSSGVVVLAVLLSLIGIAVIAAIVMYRSRIRKLANRVYQPIRKSFANDTSNIQYSSVDDTPLA